MSYQLFILVSLFSSLAICAGPIQDDGSALHNPGGRGVAGVGAQEVQTDPVSQSINNQIESMVNNIGGGNASKGGGGASRGAADPSQINEAGSEARESISESIEKASESIASGTEETIANFENLKVEDAGSPEFFQSIADAAQPKYDRNSASIVDSIVGAVQGLSETTSQMMALVAKQFNPTEIPKTEASPSGSQTAERVSNASPNISRQQHLSGGNAISTAAGSSVGTTIYDAPPGSSIAVSPGSVQKAFNDSDSRGAFDGISNDTVYNLPDDIELPY